MEKHPPLQLSVEAIEKGAFKSPSTKGTNFTLFIVNNFLSLIEFMPLFNIFFYSFPSLGLKVLPSYKINGKEREFKNWYILIQELNVICQPNRKNKRS